MNASDVIVIYPGRFHPFHKGHKGVFDLLNSKFKNVYIATSDKVEPGRSPFNFEEKVQIMGMLGVQPNNVLKVKQTYNGNEYMSRFNNSYGLIFAVSEKDMDDDPRFNFPASGMNLKKNGEPAYLQKFTDLNKIEDMTKHGYIMTVPTTTFKVGGHDVNSASQIRSLLGSDNIDDAKQAFVDLYDKYNETVFNLIHNKLGGKTMESIDINELRKLAGLQERDLDVDDDYSDVPGYKEKPMFDQLGKIIDSDDMSKDGDDIKNPLSTVKTDDGEEIEVSVDEAKALKKMMEMLPSARMGDEKSAREKFLDSIQTSEGLHSMIEFARGKGLVEEENTDEGNAFGFAQIGKKKGDKFQVKGKGKVYTKEEELNLDDIRADFGVEEGRVKDLAMDMADEYYDKVSAMVDKNNDLGKSVVDAWDDGDENPPSWALDDETRAILVNAGKIEDEPEEPEMEESEIPEGDDMQRWLAISEQYQLDENMMERMKEIGPAGMGFFKALGKLFKFCVTNLMKQGRQGLRRGLSELLIRMSTAIQDFLQKGVDFSNAFAWKMDDVNAESDYELDSLKDEVAQELEKFVSTHDKHGRLPIFMDFIKNDLSNFLKRLSRGLTGTANQPPQSGMSEQPPQTGIAKEGAKPDYIDLDGDGDREESMKKAAKDKKEKDEKKDESFDPRMEPSKKDLAINHMMDGDFEAAGGVLGGNGDDVMDEWNEYCSERGLDRKDALNDIDHVENVVDEMMSSMDDKDYPYDMGEDLDRMRELAGIEHIAEAEWDWDSGSYDEKAGYDVNFNLWSQEVQRERRAFGDKPFDSYDDMHTEFQKIMKQRGIDVFKQKQLSMAKKLEKEKEDRMKFGRDPEQKMMDF